MNIVKEKEQMNDDDNLALILAIIWIILFIIGYFSIPFWGGHYTI